MKGRRNSDSKMSMSAMRCVRRDLDKVLKVVSLRNHFTIAQTFAREILIKLTII